MPENISFKNQLRSIQNQRDIDMLKIIAKKEKKPATTPLKHLLIKDFAKISIAVGITFFLNRMFYGKRK